MDESAVADSYDDSPYIRIARNGAVTDVARTVPTVRINGARPSFDEDDAVDVARPIRSARPMPKRLSEEAREAAAEAERRANIEVDELPVVNTPVPAPRKRVAKKS